VLLKSHNAFLFTTEAIIAVFLVLIAMLSFGNKNRVNLDEELRRQVGIDALVVCGKAVDENNCLDFINGNLKEMKVSFSECNGSRGELVKVGDRKACLYFD